FVPNQRRDVVADDAIENATGALRIIKVLVELARLREPTLDTLFGDLVKLDARDAEIRALELFGDMPRNRLAFAIGVGREQKLFRFLRLALQLRDNLGLRFDDFVRLLEARLDIDTHTLGQVFDVPFAGHDLVARPQVFFDGLGLGGRFDDDERLLHESST